jgi:hypothetical protein
VTLNESAVEVPEPKANDLNAEGFLENDMVSPDDDLRTFISYNPGSTILGTAAM